MKESILNRLRKKYNDGGWNKTASLAMKGIGAGARFAGSKLFGPISLALGANKAYAPPVYDESGVNRFTGNWMGSDKPLPNVNMDDANQQLSAAMAPKINQTSGMYNKIGQYEAGGMPLLGGEMNPIPGSDAVEFSGADHDEGGIMLDPQTEVEDGETMDQVTMARRGGKRDYFFSSHLKKGGVSYADMHKNILQSGGSQQDIDYLAQMQEQAAGRDPNQVAKLGGVVKYDEGGGRINMDQIRSMYPEFATDMEAIQNYDPNLSAEENRLNENMRKGNYLYDDSDMNYVDTPMPSADNPYAAGSMAELFKKQGPPDRSGESRAYKDIVRMNPKSISPIPNQIPEVNLTTAANYIPKNTEVSGMSEEELNLAASAENTYDAYLARTEMAGEIPEGGILSEKKWNKQKRKQENQLARQLNPGMPLEAKIGAGAQFLPAITAMLTKQKDPEEFKYEPGFTSPLVAGRVKGLKYEAPNQNEARARLASSYTGEQRFLDTSGAGSSAFANRQALFAKKLQAEGTLGAQESKDEITAENLTKKSQELANARNVQNELTAATTNAQMIQKEADRKSAIDTANVQLRNMRENEKVLNRMSIASNLATGVAGVMGDTMGYKADERVAKATGTYGIYERDRIKTALTGKINPKTQKVYTE